MSKFENLLKEGLMDLEHPEIIDRKMPQGMYPGTPQQVCWIKVKEYSISKKIREITKANLIEMSGHINELGIGGWMSNQKDPLAFSEHKPTQGITHRTPHTRIKGHGKVWVVGDRKIGDYMFILTPETSKQFENGIEEPETK